LLAVALIALVGYVVIDPANQKRIRMGSYTLRIPSGVTFQRTDTGEYQLLLDQDIGKPINSRELARVASRGLLGERSPTSMLRSVVGSGWFPLDTRVCFADLPVNQRGQETWAVQYYRQAYYDRDGLAYTFRHGVLVVRNQANGGMVMDVSRRDTPDRDVIDWEPVRAHLRTLLRNTEPRPAPQPGAWADGRRRVKELWGRLLRRPKAPVTPPPDAPPPRSVPVCLGAYQLQRAKLDQQPVARAEPWARFGGYRLTFPAGAEARVAYRAKPYGGKDLLGFQNLRPAATANWLLEGDCIRGLDAPTPFHNQRGAKQRYERTSGGRRYVGLVAVVATKTPGNLIFDVSYPWPVDQDVRWEPLEAYLDDLRTAVIAGDYTAPDRGGERDHGLDLCNAPPAH
jgi:hypothetical protein